MMNLEMMIAEGEAVFSNCYGVKASKVKARKSRKARRAEKRHHANKGINVNEGRLLDLDGKMDAVRKSNKHRHNVLLSQWEMAECAISEEFDLHEFCVKTRAEIHAEEARLANMTDEEKAEKHKILVEHLCKLSLEIVPYRFFETERGKFMVSEEGEFWDEWDVSTWHTEAVYLKRYDSRKGNWEVVYTIWDETLKPRPIDVMIEDMVKII